MFLGAQEGGDQQDAHCGRTLIARGGFLRRTTLSKPVRRRNRFLNGMRFRVQSLVVVHIAFSMVTAKSHLWGKLSVDFGGSGVPAAAKQSLSSTLRTAAMNLSRSSYLGRYALIYPVPLEDTCAISIACNL